MRLSKLKTSLCQRFKPTSSLKRAGAPWSQSHEALDTVAAIGPQFNQGFAPVRLGFGVGVRRRGARRAMVREELTRRRFNGLAARGFGTKRGRVRKARLRIVFLLVRRNPRNYSSAVTSKT